MTGHQIRRSFLKYFEGKGHRVLPSSSLVPDKDPTLLFTNAGMVQFKKAFTGEEKLEFRRATTSQKCLRVSGKHNDLENVGRTTRHHTFFEMLGNFSFGDYFKQEAIDFSWEFLTEELSLPKEKLWISVFQDDDEAYRIWKAKGIPPERIVRMGAKENFWAMGETGPCGPCSEIIIDQGEGVGCRRPTCFPGCDCDRYLELWNLVFMQYNRQEDGNLVPLPKPSIDTGLGLERVAAILQGVKSNYETDLLRVTIQNTEEITQIQYGEDAKKDISFQVIADHCRGMVFLIGDGILPANEGRGYVLRRIMRRAARHGKKLNLNEPFLYKLSGSVVDQMEEAYPELKERRSYIAMVIQKEEERFLDTLDRGLQILQEEMERLRGSKGKTIPGEVVFKLYDTYGFPPDLTEDIAAEEGFTIDTEGFNKEMERQRERARMSWKGTGDQEIKEIYSRLSEDGLTVTFLGYDRLKNKSRVERTIRNDEFVEVAKEGDKVEILTRETSFYGEAGGQMGDQGVIQGSSGELQVTDTLRPLPSLILHRGRVRKGKISVGDEVTLKVDENWRQSTVLHHTATHILQSALRQVLGDHVKQSGSLVAPDRLRFDFTHFSPVEERELERVEELVNQMIRENVPVATKVTSYDEAIKGGATALFGEKYEDKVRLVRIGKLSQELCGGTHARRSGDIGMFKIVSESGVAAGIRRIEAVAGAEALRFVRKEEEELGNIGESVKAEPGKIFSKVKKLLEEQRGLEKDFQRLQAKLTDQSSLELLDKVKEVSGIKVLAAAVGESDPKRLREMTDGLKERLKSGIIVLGGKEKDKVSLVIVVTKDLTKKYHAGNLIKEIAQVVGGSGGGRPDMAQAGGTKPEKLTEALNKIYELV